MKKEKYIISFKSINGEEKSYYIQGVHYDDGNHRIDSAWGPRELAKDFNSIEDAQKEIDESGTIIPQQWIIELK